MGSVCTCQTRSASRLPYMASAVLVAASFVGCQGWPGCTPSANFTRTAHTVAPQAQPSTASVAESDSETTIRGQSPGRRHGGAASGPDHGPAARRRNRNTGPEEIRGTLAAPQTEQVVEVRVVGNVTVSNAKVMQSLHTRAGRYYDPDVVAGDVRRLWGTRKFVQVKPLKENVPGGVIVTFHVTERSTVRYVKFVGNKKLRYDRLERQTNLKIGAPLDPHAVKRGKTQIEDVYKKNGFFKARVDIVEGLKRSDLGVVYRINEGPAPKIRWINFEGNQLASDARLRSVIKTKMPIVWLFKGWLDYESIDRDVQVLTNYYKDLGYFRARVGREINYEGEGKWASVTFVIDEGPRYKIRSVTFRGNERFSPGQLGEDLKLVIGDDFSKAKLTRDRTKIVDQYGALGYIEADIEAEPRLLENEPELDLVYHIREGAVYRVARINVHITGDDPHTKITTALNRISLRPGEIVDTRKLRASQRRLRAAGIFASNPAQGEVPRITYNLRTDIPAGIAYTELNPTHRTASAPPASVRGQTPHDSDNDSSPGPSSTQDRDRQEGAW